MNERLLSPEDLVRITSARRYSKQRRWFKQQFGIDVVCNGRGEVIMLWSVFDALVLEKWRPALGADAMPASTRRRQFAPARLLARVLMPRVRGVRFESGAAR